MKKEYIAPDLYFESFVLSESIALGCNEQGITTTKEYINSGTFNEDVSSKYSITCTDYLANDSETYCYWKGTIQGFLS